jgi:HlyD family secretion protein
VFAVEDGRAVLETVEIGHRNSLAAELLDGLEAGAQVVVHPSDSLAEGAEVKERSSS